MTRCLTHSNPLGRSTNLYFMEGPGSCAQLTNPQVTKGKSWQVEGLGKWWANGGQRGSPAALNMWSSRVKGRWRKVKICRFGSGRSFWLSIIVQFDGLVKGATTLCTCRKECNKYDLTIVQCFWLVHHNDWSRWLAISSFPRICSPSFGFVAGVARN
jgi:hypothetical protein